MLNHIRTLLGNRRHDFFPTEAVGVIPADSGFRPRKLRPDASQIWQTLFGSSPDWMYLSGRLTQCLMVLHDSPLGPAADAAFDPRRSYDLDVDSPPLILPAWSAVQIDGDGELMLLRDVLADTGSGRSEFEWVITATTGANTVNVVASRDTPSVTYSTTVSGQLSAVLSLPGAGTSFRVRVAVSPASWLVRASAPPTDLGSVAQLLDTAVAGVEPSLFDSRHPLTADCHAVYASPFRTDRLAAIVLALALQIEESPVDG